MLGGVNARPLRYLCQLEAVRNLPHHDAHGNSSCLAPPLIPYVYCFTHHRSAAEGTGRELHGDVKPQVKSTVANCCHIRALSACPKGLRRSPRDDARISKWQWFLIFSGFLGFSSRSRKQSHRLHQFTCQTAHLFSQNESWSSVVLALGLIYGSDYLYVRIRMLHPKPTEPFESIKSLRVLAIPGKNGKTEYEVDAQNPEQVVTCVHALFPHDGHSPCWYVKPRLDRPIPM